MSKFSEKVRLGIAIAVIILLILFVILNSLKIRIELLFASVDMPIAFVVICSALAGAAVAWALLFVRKKG